MKLLTTTDLSLSLFTAALQLVSLGKRPQRMRLRSLRQ